MINQKYIYLDSAATSEVFPEVINEMEKVLKNGFYNPSALYGASLDIKTAVEKSRKTIAQALKCNAEEIFFTSCATESNNWVFSSGRKCKKGNVVITMGEHPSVYETANELKSRGIDVRVASLCSDGSVNQDDLLRKIDEDTTLVSIIHCSNETGAINDLAAISAKIREIAPNALIHSDGVQAFCKIESNLKNLGVDLYSVSAHKIGGAKGIGALYINKKINLAPFIYGGGQERGLRSGTENTVGIIGFAKAVQTYLTETNSAEIFKMREYITSELQTIRELIINGNSDNNSGYIISTSIIGIKAEILQHILSDKGILIGLGAACSSKSKQNRVLSALGRSPKEIEGSIRISLSPFVTHEQVRYACALIKDSIMELRRTING